MRKRYAVGVAGHDQVCAYRHVVYYTRDPAAMPELVRGVHDVCALLNNGRIDPKQLIWNDRGAYILENTVYIADVGAIEAPPEPLCDYGEYAP